MSIYEQIYNLIQNYIYGNIVVVGSYQELVLVLLSTIACIFLMALPFIVVYRIIRMWF